ncbi:MAG: GNAT family N-acetyltransferase [Ectopseudomonas guguanensis]|uniref:GNAT family N-acetyltransferase n=1 Tax=Ectopseudomonas guguanensis TaxID=1198456 RepID=UPI00391C8379
MQILTERLLIRPYRAEDAPHLHEAVQTSLGSVGRWLPWCHAGYSLDDARQWIARCEAAQEQGSAYDLGVFLHDSGDFCGSVAINQIDPAVGCGNIGYWIRQDQQGQGLASEAARAIIIFGLRDLGLKRMEIVVAVGNQPSQRLAERLGATFEGVSRDRLQLGDRPADAWVYVISGDIPPTLSPQATPR